MARTTVHLSLDIGGALRWSGRQLRGMFVHDDGRKMTADEVRGVLIDQLKLGRHVLPLGTPCEGFSYQTGCPGHPAPDDGEVSA